MVGFIVEIERTVVAHIYEQFLFQAFLITVVAHQRYGNHLFTYKTPSHVTVIALRYFRQILHNKAMLYALCIATNDSIT